MKITVDLDADLYRAIKVEAARSDRSVRAVLEEAVTGWLEEQESVEDRASADAALAEYRRDGGAAATEFYEHLAAETRETYGTTDGDQATADPTS